MTIDCPQDGRRLCRAKASGACFFILGNPRSCLGSARAVSVDLWFSGEFVPENLNPTHSQSPDSRIACEQAGYLMAKGGYMVPEVVRKRNPDGGSGPGGALQTTRVTAVA